MNTASRIKKELVDALRRLVARNIIDAVRHEDISALDRLDGVGARGRSAVRTLTAVGLTAMLAAFVSVAPAAPAAAATVITVSGCDIVVSPTADEHTTCPGWDATGISGFPGVDTVSWDYADFSGATFVDSYLFASSGALTITAADFSGATFGTIGWGSAPFAAGTTFTNVDFSNSSWTAVSWFDANLVSSNAAGMVFTGGEDIRLSGTWTNTDITGAVFDAYAGGWNITSSTVTGATLPRQMPGSNLAGIDFTTVTLRDRTQFNGSNLDGSNFAGKTLHGASFDGASANGADFTGLQMLWPVGDSSPAGTFDVTMLGLGLADTSFRDVRVGTGVQFRMDGTVVHGVPFTGFTLEPGSRWLANGVDFNSADLSGVDMSTAFADGDYVNDPVQMYGSNFAWANLAGATLRLSGGGYYGDADLAGATLFGAGEGAYFHRANLEGATFVGYWPDGTWASSLRGAEFDDALMAGVNLINTDLTGATFTRANLSGSSIQSNWWVTGVAGINLLDADLTNAELPKASWAADGSGSTWMHGLYLEGTDVSGTGLLYDSSIAPLGVSPDGSPVAVDWELPTLWQNPDGQEPYGDDYDGLYWRGASLDCSHDPGSVFPVGETVVTCAARFDHGDPTVPWDTSAFVTADPWAMGPRASGMGTPQLAPIAPFGPSVFNTDAYRNGEGQMLVDSGIMTRSAPVSFVVTVATAPSIEGEPPGGVELQPYAFEFVLGGDPEPALELVDGELPAGLALTSSGELSGTPDLGTAGEWPLTLRVTNLGGSTELDVVLTIDPAPAAPAQLIVTGAEFSPLWVGLVLVLIAVGGGLLIVSRRLPRRQ